MTHLKRLGSWKLKFLVGDIRIDGLTDRWKGISSGRVDWFRRKQIFHLLFPHVVQRPKRKPMSEFYTDGGEELENVPVDPNAPKPEGSTISPAVGEQLIVPSGRFNDGILLYLATWEKSRGEFSV